MVESKITPDESGIYRNGEDGVLKRRSGLFSNSSGFCWTFLLSSTTPLLYTSPLRHLSSTTPPLSSTTPLLYDTPTLLYDTHPALIRNLLF
jgi:hypothetical protein